MTSGETHETIMTGITVDISHICEFGWCDWVMFCDNTPTVMLAIMPKHASLPTDPDP